MEFKQLSDEDMERVNNFPFPKHSQGYMEYATFYISLSNLRAIARKAEQERDKQWVEWGEELCSHGTPQFKRQCALCWQELKAEEAG